MSAQLDLLGDLKPIDRATGKANGEFLARLIEVREGKRDLAWLMTTCPHAHPAIVKRNLAFWGIN